MARSEQSTRAREIFESALDIASAEERAAYVKSACGGDAALLERVQALLQADHVADSFLPNEPQASRVLASIEERPGTVIGRYKLLEKIGEGGMGVVYMAEQEEPVRRKVALKIIKLGMDTRQVVARFEAERQALALMDHPNIAKVFDAGMTEPPHPASALPAPEITRPDHPLPSSDEGRGQGEGSYSSTTHHLSLTTHYGRPYFVMELVQGVPITEFCDKNQISVQERIKLFIPVCQAIQSAHQKGIIHRDIKPSNVLVTLHDGVPVPKVIDFGVAKATNQRLTEKTLFTNYATMIGTPAYMSPEQAEMSGLDIDTRSDIYSLGVLLYELLTNTTPFSEQRLRSVAYSEMQRIIIEEEPERPSTRLKKTALTDSTAQLAPRPSSLATDLDWIVMKCLEKDRSRRYETANALTVDIQRHLGNEPVVARPPSPAYRFQKFVRRNKIGFTTAALVALVLTVATLVSGWQAVRATRAERTAREQAAKAMQAQKVATEQAELARQQSERAKAVQDFLAENLLGVNELVRGTTPDPDAISFETTRALVEKVARGIEGKFTNQPLTEADIRMTLSLAFAGFTDAANLSAQAEKALQIRQRLLPPGHSDTLETIAVLALGKFHMGRWNEAQKLLEDAMAIARNEPNGLSAGGANVVGNYGELLLQSGRAEDGLPYFKEALSGAKRTLDPKDLRITHLMGRIAYATELTGQWPEAERLWRDAIQQCERDHGPEHHYTVAFQCGLGRFLVGQNRSEEALPLIEQFIAFSQQKLETNHNETLDARFWQGRAYEGLGRIPEAVKVYAELYPRRLKQLPDVAVAKEQCADIARFFVRQRRYEDAKAIFGAIREFFEANPPERASDFEAFIRATAATNGWPAAAAVCKQYLDRCPDSSSLWLNKAWIFRYVGDEEQYRQVVTKVLALASGLTSTNDQYVPVEIAALGPFPFSPQQIKQLDSLRQALEVALPGRSSDQQWLSYRAIGHLQLRFGRSRESLTALENSASKRTGLDPYLLLIKAQCLHRLGRREEARSTFEQAESAIKFVEPLGEEERFLPAWQVYEQLLMRRETQAVLADGQAKQ